MHWAMNIAALAPARSKLTDIVKSSAHQRNALKLHTPLPSCTGAVLGVETHCAAPLGAALALRFAAPALRFAAQAMHFTMPCLHIATLV